MSWPASAAGSSDIDDPVVILCCVDDAHDFNIAAHGLVED